MSEDSPPIMIDLSDSRSRLRLLNYLNRLKGWHRIQILKYRRRRTDRQNRYYWPCFVGEFARHLAQEWGESVAPTVAHSILKTRFLGRSVVHRGTGELIQFVGSTSELTAVQFNQYLDQCAKFLAELGIVVPEPQEYHEPLEEAA